MASGFLLAGRTFLKVSTTIPSLEHLAKAAFSTRIAPEPQQQITQLTSLIASPLLGSDAAMPVGPVLKEGPGASGSILRDLAAAETLGGFETNIRSTGQKGAAAVHRQGVASTSQPGNTTAHAAKSHKRKAAEALLAARYGLSGNSSSSSSSSISRDVFPQLHASDPQSGGHSLLQPLLLGAGLAAQPQGLPSSSKKAAKMLRGMSSSALAGVLVKGCPPSCSCQQNSTWCKFDVRIPHTNWSTVFDSNPASYYSFLMGKGYERIYMPENLQVYVIKNPAHVAAALKILRASMQDRVVAIDLEWKPEFFNPPPQLAKDGTVVPHLGSKVAVMQLASATTCLVLHVSAMAFVLPAEVKAFLADPTITLVGFSWDGSDERKLQGSFGFGRSSFSNFVDLQEVAEVLGYQRPGLARIAKQVMGLAMVKSKKVTMSNWAAPNLTMQQIKYASLDVFVAGQVFRGLRLWHSSPSPCPNCRHPVGSPLSVTLQCGVCSSKFSDFLGYSQHCVLKGHSPSFSLCQECGRLHPAAGHKPQPQQVEVKEVKVQAAAVEQDEEEDEGEDQQQQQQQVKVKGAKRKKEKKGVKV